MNIIDKPDEEILDIAHPMWKDMLDASNKGNYGDFTKHFAYSVLFGLNEVEVGKQFAKSELTRSLSDEIDCLGIIHRGEHVTILYKQKSTKKPGEWLGRLVLGYEKGEIKIFGASIF
jgi:hypothetical protein